MRNFLCVTKNTMRDYQKGQILLIVVLIMVTTLTIGLSVAVRSVTNIRTSQDAADSEKAFSAAEAGIEKSLTNNSAATGIFSNNSSYTTSIITVAGESFALNNGEPVLKDDSSDIWLSSYPTYVNQWSGNLTIYWGQASDVCTQSEATNTMAAVELIVLSGAPANPQLTKYALDPCDQRSLVNNFQYITPGGGIVNGQNYEYSYRIPVTQGIFIRVVPLYAPSLVAVSGCCNAFPAQGIVVSSTGTSNTTERKIVSYQYYPMIPSEVLQYTFLNQ
jgi:hypothetical protein